MSDTATQNERSFEFQAEIRQLLDILIHSVYTSKDVFIRELISNATDALEKVRFSKVGGAEVYEPDRAEEIRIESREEDGSKILVISDSGIGMTEEEAQVNLGTIAHSGATAFLENLKAATASGEGEGEESKPDLSLIGRFGVGFYSVFMAAEKVVVTSRSATPDAKPIVWSSDGLGSFTISDTLESDVPRGTRIEIWLKGDEERFADLENVRSAITKYSNFVPFPIFVDDEQLNRVTALWREQPSQVDEEQYKEFFEYLSFGGQEHILKLHFAVDVPLQFSSLLFVPKTNTELLGFGEREVSIQLYVKRVLIDGENKDLLPKYLRFVTGVVESEDLPLNVSRETLQENAIITKMRDTLTRKLLDLFLKLAKDEPEQYEEFWKTFGRILKEGHQDFANREKFVDLLRFNSSTCEDEDGQRSLAAYVEAMPESQKAIYYLSGASREAIQKDARLEIFRKRGIEVFYLIDVADEFVVAGLGTYSEKQLVSADQVKPEDLDGVETESSEDDSEESKVEVPSADIGLLNVRCKEVLGDRVVDVRVSDRLVDSPACLINEDGMSTHLDRVMRMMNKDSELPKRILELNPKHTLIRNLASIVATDAKDPFVTQACEQIFEGAMLVDGFLTDPHRLVERMNSILEETASWKADDSSED